jgi:hypothetical protein
MKAALSPAGAWTVYRFDKTYPSMLCRQRIALSGSGLAMDHRNARDACRNARRNSRCDPTGSVSGRHVTRRRNQKALAADKNRALFIGVQSMAAPLITYRFEEASGLLRKWSVTV